MTRSVSSTFPSLNKAFVVGPGCAPVRYKLVSTITARLCVHLADLLPDNIRAQEIEPQAILERELMISGSKKWVNEIAGMRQLREKNPAWRPPSRWLRSPSSYPLHQPCIFASQPYIFCNNYLFTPDSTNIIYSFFPDPLCHLMFQAGNLLPKWLNMLNIVGAKKNFI